MSLGSRRLHSVKRQCDGVRRGGRHTTGPLQLIARRKLRRHAERGAQFAAGPNGLNSSFLLERALIVIVGQTPAWLDTEKRVAIRPQSDVRNTGQIHYHPASTLRIHERKLPPRNVHQFKNDRTGQFIF